MSFELDLSIADEIQIEVNNETRFVTDKLLTRLIFVSPEDTGAFKGNWYVSPRGVNRTFDINRRSAVALTEGIANIELAKPINFPTLTISNPADYGEALNSGHSAQQPAMFVELEIQKLGNN